MVVFKMVSCPECGIDVDESNLEFVCPFCGQEYDEGFYICENCKTLFNFDEELWECISCQNESISQVRYADYNEFDDEYYEDENPDVNQGWVGEHYG